MITAREVYLFAEICLDIQKSNLERYQELLKQRDKKTKRLLRDEIKRTEEKIDFLENTKTIVIALYQKQNKKMKPITIEEKIAFKEKYQIGD